MTQPNNNSNSNGKMPTIKDAAISSLLEETGYQLVQENGQRKYGPPPDWNDPLPPKGSEVFVGKLPRDMFEDELIPVFGNIGVIYETRLMMDFNGNNRGYAFVTYTNPEDAKKAIKELDNHEIRKSRPIGVCKSVDNCRLFVGGIPKTKTKEEIMGEMKRITESVSDVILYSSIIDKSKNRGFAFVEYESHKSAAMARRKLMHGKIQLWGHEVAVDWAEPEIEIDEEIMAKVTVLYVRNLMQTTSEGSIREVFALKDSLKIEKVKKLRDFAFVHYKDREDAQTALDELNGADMDGSIIEVTWAKPVDRSARQRIIRPVSSASVPGYNPYLYGAVAMDPYSGPVAYSACVARGPVIHRFPAQRRGRGAAGIRRFRTYGPPTNRAPTFKPVEMPMPQMPLHYGHQYQPTKTGRAQEDGKPYHPADYHHNLYVSASSTGEGIEPTVTSVAGPNLPPPYPPHPRMGPPAYVPVLTTYEDPGFYSYLAAPAMPHGVASMY